MKQVWNILCHFYQPCFRCAEHSTYIQAKHTISYKAFYNQIVFIHFLFDAFVFKKMRDMSQKQPMQVEVAVLPQEAKEGLMKYTFILYFILNL